jgi:excisionase family DNA binding protein
VFEDADNHWRAEAPRRAKHSCATATAAGRRAADGRIRQSAPAPASGRSPANKSSQIDGRSTRHQGRSSSAIPAWTALPRVRTARQRIECPVFLPTRLALAETMHRSGDACRRQKERGGEGVTRPRTPPTDSYFRTGTSVEAKGNAMKVVVEQGRQVTDEPAVAGVADSDEQVLTYREAAQVLKVSARTLERWTREGLVPYIRLPQRGRWSGRALFPEPASSLAASPHGQRTMSGQIQHQGRVLPRWRRLHPIPG